MSQFSTSAILLRRIEYGDYDLILSLFSRSQGKISVIAKSARKSTRRFAGVLELFSEMDVVVAAGRGLPVLQEAALKHPFAQIRAAPSRLAYASYWAELVHDWMEDGVEQIELYHLLQHVLGQLDRGQVLEAVLSILFQMRFLRLSGHSPGLERCMVCQRKTSAIPSDVVVADVARGGIACPGCWPSSPDALCLAKGTVNHLRWVAGGDLGRAARMKFSPAARAESLAFLERFVPYHLGRRPRSLRVLRQLREEG
jgi:DNA repair protein RecO (recombination protein O)